MLTLLYICTVFNFNHMKKILITAILLSVLSVGAFAAGGGKKSNTNDAASVSYTVLNQFAYAFKDAKNVVWTVNKNYKKAEFTLNGENMAVFYFIPNETVGITHIVSYSGTAKKPIATEYKVHKF